MADLATRMDEDPCVVRRRSLPPSVVRQARAHPAMRRLLIWKVAYYSDLEHLHRFSRPRGDPFSRIYLIVGGSGTIRMRGVSHRLTRGTVFFVPPLTPNSGGPGDSGWTLWWCDIVGTDAVDILAADGIDVDRPVLRPKEPQTLANLMREINDCYDAVPQRVVEAIGPSWALVTGLGRERATQGRTNPLDRALDYLGHHVADEIRVPHLAGLVGLSTRRLQGMFHEAFGMSVHAYQIGQRMERARRLLAQTEHPIAKVAREVGYVDPYYFSRHFTKVNGMTPSAFRRDALAGGAQPEAWATDRAVPLPGTSERRGSD